MRYRNPAVLETGAPEKEGREFLVLLAGVLALTLVGLGILALVADQLAPHIPFATERRMAAALPSLVPSGGPADAHGRRRQAGLAELAERVAQAMDLPAGMTVEVHYVDQPVVNAMATLGGQVYVYRGLIERLDSEDALAAVLAHEIGHVRQRHVVRAMGRGVVLVSGLSLLGLNSQGINRWIMNKSLQVGTLAYSREAEDEADHLALLALHRLYGHAAGLEALFGKVLGRDKGGVEFLRSHPLTENRLRQLAEQARQLGIPARGEPRPMPEALVR
jgi:Zn-dependent protease with chaperone function